MKDMLNVIRGGVNVDICCVTMDNLSMLNGWFNSVCNWTMEPNTKILVNNGQNALQFVGGTPVKVLEPGKNLGWMGGVNLGMKWSLEKSPAKYFLMINDDTQVLDQDYGWLTKMVMAFDLDPKVGAVGPMSNRVMGGQNSNQIVNAPYMETTVLSGMAMLVKKDIIREIGMLDESLPGGDDLDYSIRLRKAGYKLVICRRTFLIHHQGVTGRRLHGAEWDGQKMTEAINTAIIKKHGFKAWFNCVNGRFETKETHPGIVELEEAKVLDDIKEDLESGLVLDLGCGGKKIHQKAVGVDFRPNGELGCGCNAYIPSTGDVVADVSDLKPFADNTVDAIVAKHIFEHILDIPKALKEWKRVLKPGGKIVIVCPDWRFSEAIGCDPSHVHAFTPDAVKSWFEALGWEVSSSEHIKRTFVFKTVASKPVEACSCHSPELLAEVSK